MIFSFLFFSNLFAVNFLYNLLPNSVREILLPDSVRKVFEQESVEKNNFFNEFEFLFNYCYKRIKVDPKYELNFNKTVENFFENSEKKIEYLKELNNSKVRYENVNEFREFYDMVLKTMEKMKKEKSVDEFLNFIYRKRNKELIIIYETVLPAICIICALIFIFSYFSWFPTIFPIIFPILFPIIFPIIFQVLFAYYSLVCIIFLVHNLFSNFRK